jgi:hypothetical protein
MQELSTHNIFIPYLNILSPHLISKHRKSQEEEKKENVARPLQHIYNLSLAFALLIHNKYK